MQVITEQELTLISFLKNYSRGIYKRYLLSSEEFDLLKNFVDILSPVQNISDNLFGENYVTASLILPTLKQIENKFFKSGNIT